MEDTAVNINHASSSSCDPAVLDAADSIAVAAAVNHEHLGPYEKIDEPDDDGEKAKDKCCCSCILEKGQRTVRGVKWFAKDVRQLVKDVDWRDIQEKNLSVNTLKRKFPIVTWLPKYRVKHFIGDLIAGLTVALTVIPQGLAYAQVANLSPEYGLYTSFFGCIVYVFLGSAKDITFGPTAVMSLLVGVYATSPISKDPTYAIILSFLGGFILLAMALFRIGFIVAFVSHPVINSFTTAAGITIAWGQVKSWLGLKQIPQDFLGQVYWTFKKLPETKLWDFVMGLCCLVVLYVLKKVKDIKWKEDPNMPLPKKILKQVIFIICTARNAIVVIIAAGIAAGLYQRGSIPFSLTGTIRKGLPSFQAPSFSVTHGNTTIGTTEILSHIGTGFIIVPVLALVELMAIGKVFAKIENYNIDANQELLALGVANVIGSFVGAYPVTGSFSRTAVNYQSGVKTTAGGIWTATLVLLALAFLTPLFFYIPNSALAAVIIMAVFDLIDFSLLVQLWRVKKIDIFPWVVTFVCSLCIGIEYGIMIGVGVSVVMVLIPLGRPNIDVTLHDPSWGGPNNYIILTPDRGFVYPAVEYLVEKIEKRYLSDGSTKSIILNLTHFCSVDYTAVEGIGKLVKECKKRDQQLIVCNLRPSLLEVIRKAKIKNFVYAENIEMARELLEDKVLGDLQTVACGSSDVKGMNGLDGPEKHATAL